MKMTTQLEKILTRRIPSFDTIQDAIFFATGQLASTTPRLDAEILLAYALKISRGYCYTHPEQALTAEQQLSYQELIERRLKGEPIAYIVGKQEFWHHYFIVTPATLIPRPETELLVQLLLNELPTESELQIADLGTGSGAIALSLAKERPNWHLTATDFCKDALQVAKQNAQKLQVDNIQFSQGSWCLALPQHSYHAIVANPPYIAAGDPHLDWGGLRFEPKSALVAGPDGLSAMREIVTNAGDYLLNGGFLLLEHGYDQGQAVRELLESCGFIHVQTERDLAGHDRVTKGVWQNK
jgi:release factor glutamine methyltransferase